MTQGQRDRLVALKKAKKKLITQREAAAELGISERQVRRPTTLSNALRASPYTLADQAGEGQRVEQELRSEEGAEGLASGPKFRQARQSRPGDFAFAPAQSLRSETSPSQWAENQNPRTGNTGPA
jgi:hypothetical protein